MNLFPHVLARVGGNSFDFFDHTMKHSNLNTLLEELDEMEQIVNQQKSDVCDTLHRVIGTLESTKDQNLVLNLRRNIFNDRNVKTKVIEKTIRLLSPDSAGALVGYLQSKEKWLVKKEEAGKEYEQSLQEARKSLQVLVKNDALQKGLVISSRALLKSADQYSQTEVTLFKKKEFRTELSLLKYITRMCMKTSPFSTFTQLTLAKLTAIPDGGIREEGGNHPEAYTSTIRLNNLIFKYIKDLIFNHREAVRYFRLRHNPTVLDESAHLLFYVNRSGEESFQQLKKKEVLRIILQTIKNEQGITWFQFCNRLKEQIDADDVTLDDYVHRLVQLGFLEFDLGIPSYDAKWDIKLVRYLNTLPGHAGEYFAPLTQALIQIRHYSKIYASTDVNERALLQDKAYQELKQVTQFLHSSTVPADVVEGGWNDDEAEEVILPFREENIFYEDVVSDLDLQIDECDLNNCVNSFHSVMKAMDMFDMEVEEKFKIRDFFIKQYGANATIDLLQFYQDYYKEYKLSERLAQKEQNKEAVEALLSTSIKERRMRLQEWKDQFRERMLGKEIRNDVLNISISDFPNLNTGHTKGEACSHGAFMQLFKGVKKAGQPGLMAVCNNYVHGYGKLLSRYLHLFDSKVWRDTVTWNQKLEKEMECYAENSDGSHFNANIHPPLMTAEISHAQGQSNLPEDRQLRLIDLEVRYNMSNDRLVLFHRPSEKSIYTFDLGFENSRSRSELFKVFTGFSKAKSLTWKPVNHIVNQHAGRKIAYKEDTIINVSPRIVYEDRIVLKRKSWWIPVACLPTKEPLQTDWDYYYTIHRWYKQLDLPDHIFVTVKPYRHAKPHEKESTDDYKPQYIHFKNPLLVRLLGTLVLRADQAIVIEEMYPNPDQLLIKDEQRYVTEYLVQWDDQ